MYYVTAIQNGPSVNSHILWTRNILYQIPRGQLVEDKPDLYMLIKKFVSIRFLFIPYYVTVRSKTRTTLSRYTQFQWLIGVDESSQRGMLPLASSICGPVSTTVWLNQTLCPQTVYMVSAICCKRQKVWFIWPSSWKCMINERHISRVIGLFVFHTLPDYSSRRSVLLAYAAGRKESQNGKGKKSAKIHFSLLAMRTPVTSPATEEKILSS